MKKNSSKMALVLMLLIAAAAMAQNEQTVTLEVRVAPYLQVSQEPMVFSQSKDNPGVFDTGWTTVAHSNAPWNALLSLNPVFVSGSAGGRMLDTEYEIQTRVNGEITRRNVTLSAEGISSKSLPCAHGTPHNGLIEMRIIARVINANQTQNLATPRPPGMTFMTSF